MQITNRGIMFVTLSLGLRRDEMADEEYIRKLRASLEARSKADREQVQKENREDEIIKVESPKQWTTLKEWLRKAVDQVSEGQSSEIIEYIEEGDLDEIALRCILERTRPTLKVKFFG